VIVAAALLLPGVLDTPRVRAEIQRILSEAVRGDVDWDELSIRILPVPHGSLRKARLEIPRVASVSAEEAEARLRLWPLFHGRVEITSVSVTRPVIRISVVPAAAAAPRTREVRLAADIIGLYRSAIGPVVEAVREFAPDTLVTVEDAELEVLVPGTPPMKLNKLTLRARAGTGSMELDATAASQYWSWVALSSRLEYADLSARANLRGLNILPNAWLERYVGGVPVGVSMAPVRLRVEARTDAKTSLNCDFEAGTDSVSIARAGERVDIPKVAIKGAVRVGADETVVGVEKVQLGDSRLAAGELRLSAKDGVVTGQSDYDLDIGQGMDYTRRLVPIPVREVLASLQPVTGRAQGRVRLALRPSGWSVGVEVRKSDVAVQVRDLPGPLRLAGGAVEIDPRKVKLDRVALSMPAGKVLVSTLQHRFKDGSTAGEARFDLDVGRWLELVRRALPQEDRELLADIQTAAGRIEGDARFAYGRGSWKFGLNVLKSDAALGLRQLPGPIRIARWSVDAGPTAVTVDRAAISLLDASAVASMTVDEFDSGPRMRGTIAEGTIGEDFLAWVWNTAKLPPRYEPATPIRIRAPRITWRPGGALELQASAQFDAGPNVAADLGWDSGVLEIRRSTIQDGRSNAELALSVSRGSLEGRYAGALHSTSIAAVLKRAKMPSGNITGDLRFAVDRAHPERMTAEGHLNGEALDLAALTAKPIRIDRIDLATDDDALRVREATVDWAGQRVTLRGDLKRGESGPIINARLESPGIDLDKLLTGGEKTAVDLGAKPAAGAEEAAKRLWPLPVTGRIAMRADSIQRGRHKIAPVAATLVLELRRAHLDLEEARLCGISLPLVLEATPEGYTASARIGAQKQQLEQTAHCLSGENVLITGLYDLKADISTQGKLAELPNNLKGTVRADAAEGKVMKFALLGNILSMRNIATLMKEGGPKVDEEGFPYRTLTVAGHFEKGQFVVDEGAFQSDALGLAANGWIALNGRESRLTVLVAPFSRLDQLVRKVPLVGYVVGGTFTSVPVGVSGDIRNPLVVPLGPAAVGSEVLGIFERTLKLPAKLITPLEGE
jgi:uncharacterized protein involved in outer membrane biogenesis